MRNYTSPKTRSVKDKEMLIIQNEASSSDDLDEFDSDDINELECYVKSNRGYTNE